VKKTIYSKQKYVPKKGSSNKKNSPRNGALVSDSPPSRNPGGGIAFSSTVTLGQIPNNYE
jgi:hypothetical protein